MKRVSIVLLNWNNERDTVRCLKSLAKVDYPDFEVVVVDNGSDEASVRRLRQHLNKNRWNGIIKTRLIELNENRGCAGGRNLGVRKSKNNYVLLLDNDATVNKGYLKELVETFSKGKNIGLVGPKIVNKGCYNHLISYETIWDLFGSGKQLPPNADKSLTFGVSGCSIFFDKRVIDVPFEEDYFVYGEDTYLSWILSLKGYKHLIARKSVVTHESTYERRRVGSFNFVFHGTKNQWMNDLIFFELNNLFKILPLLFAHELFILVALSSKNPHVFFLKIRSYWWIIKNFKKIWHKRKEIQALRKLSDRDLSWGFTCRQPYFNGFFGRLVDSAIFLYCWVVRFPVREVYK